MGLNNVDILSVTHISRTPRGQKPRQALPAISTPARYLGYMRVMSIQVAGPSAPGALQSLTARLRRLRARDGRMARGLPPEGARVKAALDMHELGVKLYRQRMRREHPQASTSEINAMVRAWLAEPPRSGSLHLPSRERDRGIR